MVFFLSLLSLLFGRFVDLLTYRVFRLLEKRQERVKQDTLDPSSASLTGGPSHSTEGTPVPSDTHPTPTTSTLPLLDLGHDSGHEDNAGTGSAGGAGGGMGGGGAGMGGGGPRSGKDAHPPTKKYRLTEDMKALIWQLVCLSNECCRIENEKK